MDHAAARVDDVGDVAFALAAVGRRAAARWSGRSRGEGSSRSSSIAPMQYLRIGPTPWVKTSQPASVSMGEPQLPICMNSQGLAGA